MGLEKNNVTDSQIRSSKVTKVLREDGPTAGESMMPSSVSLLEATKRTTIISTRTTTNIGTWNVRTMFETGKTAQVAAEMRRYNLDLLGISESRWTGSGQHKLATGELLLYSGHEEANAPHSQGVALMLTKMAQRPLIGWEAHGPRIIMACFRTTNRRIIMDVIQCYAPTNESDENIKEDFYNRLQTIIQARPRRNIIFTMGDFNAKIGSNNQGYEEVMGKQGLGEMNENGERFANLCATTSLVIGGSFFQHKQIHKATWVSPDLKTENQIDHVCIMKKFRRSLEDVRVKRGADFASDHHLLSARMMLKRNWTGQSSQRQRYNITALKETDRLEEFKTTLSKKAQIIQRQIEGETINEKWQSIKEALTSTCQEVLGNMKQGQKEWISAGTLKKIQERKRKKADMNNSRTRTTKAKAKEQYSEANRIVKRSIRTDKRNYMETLAGEAEDAAQKGNMRELYANIKRLSGKFSQPARPVKDRDGKTIPGLEQQKHRRAEHFEDLLNRPSPPNPINIQPASCNLPIDCDAPSKEEMLKAIKQLRNGKSAGPDAIPAEALKADEVTTVDMLYPLFQKIWEEEDIPSEWKEGHLIKLPKKGDLSSCSNYRGITLLSTPGKIFNRVLLNRMKEVVDTHLWDQQAGFRKSRSCTDQITTLRIILEQSLEWNSPFYVRYYGVPAKITNIIRNSNKGITCRVVHGQQLTEVFQVQTGVRQGCLLSPFLFLLAIDR